MLLLCIVILLFININNIISITTIEYNYNYNNNDNNNENENQICKTLLDVNKNLFNENVLFHHKLLSNITNIQLNICKNYTNFLFTNI